MGKTRLHPAKNPGIADKFDAVSNVVLHHGGVEDFVKTLPDQSVKLIVTSPPYNLGKEYETRIELSKYIDNQRGLINQFDRVLNQEGSICWQVGNFVENGEVFPLDIYFYDLFKSAGFKLRNRIVWHFGHGLHARKRFSGRYETVLWFTKGDSYTFNLDSVRVPQKYPGKRHFKGEKKGLLSGNPMGKNPSDFWGMIQSEWENGLFDIPNVKANHPEKTVHPCQFPIELVERLVLALTNKGDRVFDPYAGVGSSIIASIKNERIGLGAEKEDDYVNIAKKRVNDFYEGKLKIRKLGKPVYKPTGKEKVSQLPIEWNVERS